MNRRDENDGMVADARQRLVQVKDSGRIERERRPHGDDNHWQPVPDEENDDRRDNRECDGNCSGSVCLVACGPAPPLRMARHC